jgi:phosphoglycolate phosphatase (TIGR01487 family)
VLKAFICDVDGTLTDRTRRINARAIDHIRVLIDHGIEVVLASGNTACFMDALSRMIGTGGTIVAENGGVYRIGYTGTPRIHGDRETCWKAYRVLEAYFARKGITLDLLSPEYRYTDIAIFRSIPAEEVKGVVKDYPVRVIDTGYAIHLQVPGFTKGDALAALAQELGLDLKDVLAIGDSVNDVEMIRGAGVGVAVENAHPDAKHVADWIADRPFGDGVIEAIRKYFPDFSYDE